MDSAGDNSACFVLKDSNKVLQISKRVSIQLNFMFTQIMFIDERVRLKWMPSFFLFTDHDGTINSYNDQYKKRTKRMFFELFQLSYKQTTITLFCFMFLCLFSFINSSSLSSPSSAILTLSSSSPPFSPSLSSSLSSSSLSSSLTTLSSTKKMNKSDTLAINIESYPQYSNSSIELIVKSLRNSSISPSHSLSSLLLSSSLIHSSLTRSVLPLEGSHLTINIPNQSLSHSGSRIVLGPKTKHELENSERFNNNGQSNNPNNNDNITGQHIMMLSDDPQTGQNANSARFKHSSNIDEDDEDDDDNDNDKGANDDDENDEINSRIENFDNDTLVSQKLDSNIHDQNPRASNEFESNSGISRDDVDFVMHSPRTVNTKYGALQGVVMTFVRYSNSSATTPTSLTPVEAFLSVPYASPPSGILRFMPPVAPLHWRGVRQANHLSFVCPQHSPEVDSETDNKIHRKFYEQIRRQKPFLRNQSEDCLYLNIYVPFEQYFQQRHQFRPHQRSPSKQRKQHQSSRSKTHQKVWSDSQTFTSTSSSNSSKGSNKYAVVVFIHGTSFDWDSGNSYDPSVWSSLGKVIVVTLNYRLGILGFLPALVDGTIRGNYGLMDQVAALHWVQENIAEFGGDPNNVTVVGHSFGAACAHLLMISPMAKGLFNRVILMSGSALSPFSIARDAEHFARLAAKKLNCPIYDNVQLVECLKRKSIDELLGVSSSSFRFLSAFGPIVDGIVVPYEPRLTMQYIESNYIAAAASPPISSSFSSYTSSSSMNNAANLNPFIQSHFNGAILIGNTLIDFPFSNIFSSDDERFGITVQKRDQILRTLVRNLFDFHQQTIFWTLITEYTDWSRPSEHPINLLDSILQILTDALTSSPMMETLEFYRRIQALQFNLSSVENNKQTHKQQQDLNSLFFYVFNNQQPQSSDDSNRLSIEQRTGSMHGEELDYLFGAPISESITGRSVGHFNTKLNKPNDIALSKAMITYFTNFVKFGNPNGITSQESILTSSPSSSIPSSSLSSFSSSPTTTLSKWPVYTSIQKRYLLLGQSSRVRDHYHAHRLSFWLNLIPRFMNEQYSRKMDNGHGDEHHSAYDKDDDLGGFLYLRHHLLDNFNDLSTYDGSVRDITLKSLTSGTSSARVKSTPAETGWLRTSGSILNDNIGNESLNLLSLLNRKFSSGIGGSKASSSVSSLHNNTGSIKSVEAGTSSGQEQQDPNSPVPGHLTALAVTIMVGFSLLVLNIFIFVGVYYQLNRHSERQQHQDDSNGTVLLYETTNNSNHFEHQYHQHSSQIQQQHSVINEIPSNQQQHAASKSLCAHYTTLHYDDTSHSHAAINGSLLPQTDVCSINGNARSESVVTGVGSGNDHNNQTDSSLHLISTIKSAAQALDIFGDSSVLNGTNPSGHVHHVHYSDSITPDNLVHHQHHNHSRQQQQHLHMITANDLSDSNTALLMTANPGAAMLGQYYPLQSFSSASGSGTTSTSTTGAETSGLFLLDSAATSSNQSIGGTLQRNSTIRFSLSDSQQKNKSKDEHRVKI